MSIPATESPVTPADLHVLGEEVRTAFLLEHDLADVQHNPLDPRRVTASIAVRGGWSGRITLEVSGTGAEDLTRRMLHADDVSADEVVDAIGELVNVLGGNVKSLLVEESTLGLPEVTDGESSAVAALAEVCHTELSWAGHPVQVRVWLEDQVN